MLAALLQATTMAGTALQLARPAVLPVHRRHHQVSLDRLLALRVRCEELLGKRRKRDEAPAAVAVVQRIAMKQWPVACRLRNSMEVDAELCAGN